MHLLIISTIILLALVGCAATSYGKKSSLIKLSEYWKIFFSIILFSISKGMDLVDPTLKYPKYGMFAFACILLAWFVIPIFIKRFNSSITKT